MELASEAFYEMEEGKGKVVEEDCSWEREGEDWREGGGKEWEEVEVYSGKDRSQRWRKGRTGVWEVFRGEGRGGVMRKVRMERERRGDARKVRKGDCEEKVYSGTYVQ
jgi:hypothetical protein